jgi:tetratricopeptide (TPR) repeat protein
MKRTTLWMTAVCCLVPLSWLSCADSSALVFGAGEGGRGGGGASRSGGGGGARPSTGGGQRASVNRGPSFTRSGGNVGAAEARRSEDGNRSFGRNTFNVGNQSINIGHNSYRPAYARHGAYHGYWNGNWGLGAGIGGNYGWGNGYGGYGWSPLGWGLGAWGLGALGYNSGYLGYSNPYYNGSGIYGNFNYSQPIPVAYDAPALSPNNGVHPADGILNDAVAAFKTNDYAAALDIADKGIAQFPDDSVLHEFRALTLFAQGSYQPAAAAIHSLLAVGPGWDWATLSSMYPNVAVYTGQLRKLESFVRNQPQNGAARFLLAYQYLSSGNVDSAENQLAQVVKLVPNDRVAADMLKMASASRDGRPAETVVAAKPVSPLSGESKPTATPIDPATLVGTWKALRDDGSKFELTLGSNSTFDWKFTQSQPQTPPDAVTAQRASDQNFRNPDQKRLVANRSPQEFGGTYTFEKNVLALQRKNGGSLIAEVTPGSAGNFNFKLLGGPADDPGLTFNR